MTAGGPAIGVSVLQGWLELAHAAADAADTIALDAFGAVPSGDPAAGRDVAVRAATTIRRSIDERLTPASAPGGGTSAGVGPVRWLAAALDGAESLSRNIPMFATHLAAVAEDEVQVGLVSAPALGRRWWAGRGLGAWSTGAPQGSTAQSIRVTPTADVAAAHVIYRDVRPWLHAPVADGFWQLLRRAGSDNGYGDCVGFALVAEGAADVMLDDRSSGESPALAAAVFAAGQVLVEEAGGRLTDLQGRRGNHAHAAIATNRLLHESVLSLLAGSALTNAGDLAR